MKRSAVVLMVLGVVFLIFAFTVPPFMTGKLRTLPTDAELTLVSTSPQGIEHTERIQTFPTAEVDEIRVEAAQEYTDANGGQLAEIDDHVTLIGHSRFPVFDPTAIVTGTPVEAHDEVREGLRYFFPANTQRQSYPYFDEFLHAAEPVDYAGREGDTYIFHQDIQREELADSTPYSVERTLWVDRRSGLVVDKHETVSVHKQQGDQIAEFSFTDSTRADMEERAADITNSLTTAKILDFFAKFLGLVLLSAGVWRTGIFRTKK